MSYESKLPDKPSELIRVALGDLQKCIDDPHYSIDMNNWHVPCVGYCSVCLAGAVMAKTFEIDPRAGTTPGKYFKREWNNPDFIKLEALDRFRCGQIYNGLICMRLDPSPSRNALDEAYRLGSTMRAFNSDYPEHFLGDMRLIVRELERVGY